MTSSESLERKRAETRERNRFVLYDGLLCAGLPFATVMMFLDLVFRLPSNPQAHAFWQAPAEFAFMAGFFGLIMGEYAWRTHGSRRFQSGSAVPSGLKV